MNRQPERGTGGRRMIIALAGNPNCGKTSLFNAITGAHQHVGNYSGVTVDFKEGTAHVEGTAVTLVDLPGIYSLTAQSTDEQVARDFIINRKPDMVINVIDASNLERNLYLTIQLMELGIRPILAFNMWDEATQKGVVINTALLSTLLDLPIVTTNGKNGHGVGELLAQALDLAQKQRHHMPGLVRHLQPAVRSAVETMATTINPADTSPIPSTWTAIKLLEKDPVIMRESALARQVGTRLPVLSQEIQNEFGDPPEALIAQARFGFIAGALKEAVSLPPPHGRDMTHVLDAILTHRVFAYPLFLAFMWILFQATFVLGAFPMQWIDAGIGFLSQLVGSLLPDGAVKSLVTDGIIGGCGNVLVFLPNILILFFGISIMEDTGYMSRAAFITDRIMHGVGLHGKSFIPMLMGLGCSVPAIMAARTLESPGDRLKTILLVPLMSCSARLPVYILFAGALFPAFAGSVVFLFQFILGTSVFFLMGFIFKVTLFKRDDQPFVMELPPYRLPTLRSIGIHMWHKAQHYLRKIAGVVLFFSIVLWFLSSYPRDRAMIRDFEEQIRVVHADSSLSTEARDVRIDSIGARHGALLIQSSYMGTLGHVLEPVVRPIGLDWRAAIALATGFFAKEIVVSTLGVIYAVEEHAPKAEDALRNRIAQVFTPLTGVVIMLFVLLYTPCLSTIATVYSETKSLPWTVFSVSYQLVLAWTMSFGVYRIGLLLGFS